MNLIITGCEYAGKSTLVKRVAEWKEQVLGTSVPLVWFGDHRMPQYHDHFSFPELGANDLSEEEAAAMWSLSPRLRKFFLTWGMYYHLSQVFYDDNDHILVGFHLEESVYAPLYYGYGELGDPPQPLSDPGPGDHEEGAGHGARDAEGLAGGDPGADEGQPPRARPAAGEGRRARAGAVRPGVPRVDDPVQVRDRHDRQHRRGDVPAVRGQDVPPPGPADRLRMQTKRPPEDA